MTALAADCWESHGVTFKLSLAGREFYLLLADAPGGGCADISIRGARVGSELFGYWTTIAGLASSSLRRGVAVADICTEMVGVVSEPRGLVLGHRRITAAQSFSDLLGLVLFDRYDRQLVQLAIALAELGARP